MSETRFSEDPSFGRAWEDRGFRDCFENLDQPNEPPQRAGCGGPCESVARAEWNPDVRGGECFRVQNDHVPEEPLCPVVADLVVRAQTAGQIAALLKLHRPDDCVHCSPERKPQTTKRAESRSAVEGFDGKKVA